MNKRVQIGIIIVIIGLIIAILGLLMLSGDNDNDRCFVLANRVFEEPSSYINISGQDLELFPHLKDAILTGDSGKFPCDEMENLKDFFIDPQLSIAPMYHYVKYQNEYYSITLNTISKN